MFVALLWIFWLNLPKLLQWFGLVQWLGQFTKSFSAVRCFFATVLGLWVRDCLAKFVFLGLGSICSLGLSYFHTVLLYLKLSLFGPWKNIILDAFVKKKKKKKTQIIFLYNIYLDKSIGLYLIMSNQLKLDLALKFRTIRKIRERKKMGKRERQWENITHRW